MIFYFYFLIREQDIDGLSANTGANHTFSKVSKNLADIFLVWLANEYEFVFRTYTTYNNNNG